jgi:hypothetical protein
MSEAEVSRLSKDIILKRVVSGLSGGFFSRFGLAFAPIVAALPTELPVLEVRGQRADLLFELADGTILHLEFQTTRKRGDLLRFFQYQLAAYEHYGRKPVFTVILHGPGIMDAPDTLWTGSGTFTVRNLLLGTEDGEAVLRRLREKRATGQALDARDRIDIILLPLMRHRQPLEVVLREVAEVARQLPVAEQEQTIGALVGLAYHYVDEAVSTAILEALRMTNALEALLEESIARGIAQGIEQGRELGIEQGRELGIEQGRELGIEQGRELGIELGRAEGRAEGERALLRRYLAQRFGTIPPALDQRIEQADAEAVTALFDRALTVEHIGQL